MLKTLRIDVILDEASDVVNTFDYRIRTNGKDVKKGVLNGFVPLAGWKGLLRCLDMEITGKGFLERWDKA